MMQGRNGALLTMSYLGAVQTIPNYNVMGVAKASLEANVRYLSAALGPEGIRVNSVHPGPVETPMTEARRADPAVRELMLSRIPIGRYGQPEDIAYGVLYLASDEAGYITGSELVIDGGWTAQ